MKSLFQSFIGMTALTLTLGLTACGDDKTKTQTAPTTQADTIPTLKVVTDGESPPMSFVDEHGNPQGIDIDVIREIGESQGFKVEIHRDAFENIFSGIDGGKYDVAISSLSLTPERASKYGYSDTYLHNPSIIMHNQTNLNHINELKNLRVATTKGTIYTPLIEEVNPVKHHVTTTNFQGFQGILQGHYDATMGDKYILEYMAVRHSQKQLNTLEHKIGDGSSANMVIYARKSNQELIDKLNKGINLLKQSGKINTIIKTYIPHHS